MPTKQGSTRPRVGHGLASDVPSAATETKRNASAKAARNRNRVQPAKPKSAARRSNRSR